jgi:hypothetical protein
MLEICMGGTLSAQDPSVSYSDSNYRYLDISGTWKVKHKNRPAGSEECTLENVVDVVNVSFFLAWGSPLGFDVFGVLPIAFLEARVAICSDTATDLGSIALDRFVRLSAGASNTSCEIVAHMRGGADYNRHE